MCSNNRTHTVEGFLESTLSLVRDHAFNFYSVGHFCPISIFSGIQFEMQSHGHFIAASKLFNLSTITDKLTRYPELQKSFKNMVSMCHDPGIDLSFASSKANEKSTFKKIVDNVLSKLGNVVMSKQSYGAVNEDDDQSSSGRSTNVYSDWLGLGTPQTWHGYPDARIRIGSNDTTVISSTDDDPTSPGNSLPIEAKLCVSAKAIRQLTATCVVAAFTETNKHQHLASAIPSLMITPTRGIICVYDPEDDILLISETFKWVDDDNGSPRLIHEGLLLLWMVINYRDLLYGIRCEEGLKSTIKEKLSLYGSYDKFKTLISKNSRFKEPDAFYVPAISVESTAEILVAPKRRRLQDVDPEVTT